MRVCGRLVQCSLQGFLSCLVGEGSGQEACQCENWGPRPPLGLQDPRTDIPERAPPHVPAGEPPPSEYAQRSFRKAGTTLM